jgi:hypothetical protein
VNVSPEEMQSQTSNRTTTPNARLTSFAIQKRFLSDLGDRRTLVRSQNAWCFSQLLFDPLNGSARSLNREKSGKLCLCRSAPINAWFRFEVSYLIKQSPQFNEVAPIKSEARFRIFARPSHRVPLP